MIYGNYIGRNKYEVTHTLDGGNFSSVPWVSGLINGKGRYIDKTTGNKIQYSLCSIHCEIFPYKNKSVKSLFHLNQTMFYFCFARKVITT